LGDSRDTQTVEATGELEGGGVAGVMELVGQQGHPDSGSSRGLRGGRGSRDYGAWRTAGTPTQLEPQGTKVGGRVARGYGAWGTAGIPTQWEQQGTQRGEG
jgi:hypothetical protein